MVNPRLTPDQLTIARDLLRQIRTELSRLTAGDPEFLFALRRKVAKELVYDERGTPQHRAALKRVMRERQGGLCARCAQPLPPSYCVLDRTHAIGGYVEGNFRLICEPCDKAVQLERRFT